MVVSWWRLGLLVLWIYALVCVDARRSGWSSSGAGGSTRYGYRSRARSSSQSGTRLISRYRSPKRFRGAGYQPVSWNRQSTRYQTSDSEPIICVNQNPANGGTYGYFVCPEPDQPDDYAYCCGDIGNQTCCQYLDYLRLIL